MTAGWVLLLLAASSGPQRVQIRAAPPVVGFPVPSVNLHALDGTNVDPSGPAEHPRVLFFWARWCDACTERLPAVAALAETWPDASFLAVSLDRDPDVVPDIVRDLPLPVLLDPMWRLAGRLQVEDLPVTFVVDSQGIVRARLNGDPTVALPGALRAVR